MALETGNYIGDLVSTNPASGDGKAQGDDHIRLIKKVLKNTFGDMVRPFGGIINVTGARNFVQSDCYSTIAVTGALTLTFTDLGDYEVPFQCRILALTANVTLDMTGADLINGAGSFFIPQGTFADIIFTGTSMFGSQNIFSGAIVMWTGDIANVPAGWKVCDGTNGTPDLRNRFPVGAGSSYAVTRTGGTADAILVAHSHSVSAVGDHSHTFPVLQAQWGAATSNTTGGNYAQVGTVTTSGAGAHSHSISTEGSSGVNANLPPYYAVHFLQKV